ncbi:MAG: 2-dehydropantoate 2-reductase [Gammaproteobacteria bacterium]|nr:MAG: 2-dehydropantoate 2-reductase [Gammaproteobacteria bacterium]RLA60928.1 MAG: 2-dehydropantoate 2-reductase [Gammaproteobacteria bacterium]
MAAHWHVLGAGAIGCLFATALHRSGCTTTLLLRDSASKSTSSVLVQRSGAITEIQLPVSATGDNGPITHLLVTTKAYDVRGAVAAVAHRLNSDTRLLLLVNGMGLAEALREDYPTLDIYCGTTTEGAYRIAPLHIRHAGTGQTRIGKPGQTEPAPWFRQWSRALDSCVWDANIERALWLKLAINCVINPLTAIHDCHNGDLARRPELTMEVGRLCDEIAAISNAAGYVNAAADLEQAVTGVIADTANNRSSMLQDVQGGRRTEIDYITGYLLAVAGRCGIAAPRNKSLFERVHNIELNY